MLCLKTLGSFVFSYVADKQTNKQMYSKILPTPTVGVGNKLLINSTRSKMSESKLFFDGKQCGYIAYCDGGLIFSIVVSISRRDRGYQ